MQPSIAEDLIGGLETRIKGLPNPEKFVEALERTEVAQSKRFYEPLPYDRQPVQDDPEGNYHMVSIRRILRNRNAHEQHSTGLKKWWANFVYKRGFYSSNVLTRKMRTDPAVIGLMKTADAPYSLLAKLETFEFDNAEEQLFIITKPVLIIPGQESNAAVQEWEDSVKMLEEERFTFLGMCRLSRQKRISEAQYDLRKRQIFETWNAGYVS